MKGIARLTSKLMGEFTGRVHSVFNRVINLEMETDEGVRLLALAERELSPIPDSVAVVFSLLPGFERGMPCSLTVRRLTIGKTEIDLNSDTAYTGQASLYTALPDSETLEELHHHLGASGFDLLPPQRREKALRALTSADATRYVGLGPGLTPSYDDALVGVMAACSAEGFPFPFDATKLPLKDTTDVSARYLRLAMEGYYGQALLDVLEALHSKSGLAEKAKALSRIGASSGKDMLLGLWLCYQHLLSMSEKNAFMP